MKTVIVLSLVGAALGAPTKTIENRQLSSVGSGLGSSSAWVPRRPSFQAPAAVLALWVLAAVTVSVPYPSLLPSSGSGLESLGGSSSDSGWGALSSLIPSLGSGLSDASSDSGISSLLGGIAKRQLTGSMTANDVTDNAGCKALTFIFARGSDEMGNMGSIVGPEVATQLKSLTDHKVSVQGVTYSATAEVCVLPPDDINSCLHCWSWNQTDESTQSNVALGANGGPIMANLVETALKQCPNTKVVLGGYSQGSMVVHNAANRLTASQVSGAVLFGDPFKTEAVGKLASSKVKEYCASGDPVCGNGFNVMAHLSYGSDAKEAAQFLIQAAGLSTSS
ncbi:uncharacterized protein N7482_000262 [Penicillium canariense]|uniref:Cutinase n=1 Tax=Penicillium canariense TaxID=189055 RepID=A0A9W9IE23_9EURO|nr:uncharacterized protein N7482_000262 [Penicillium canariense]KAJ5174385.1 hypothetical protein N7482_000262 [Penicillium canariense]